MTTEFVMFYMSNLTTYHLPHELIREVKPVEEDYARRQGRDAPPARPPPRVYHQSHRVEDNSGLKQLREEVSKWRQEVSGTLDSMKATLDRDMRREPRPATTQARQVGPTYRFVITVVNMDICLQ